MKSFRALCLQFQKTARLRSLTLNLISQKQNLRMPSARPRITSLPARRFRSSYPRNSQGAVSGEDFTLYRSLRSVNPSPYMFYLKFGDIKLIGASPEILVRLTDGKIELRRSPVPGPGVQHLRRIGHWKRT